MEAGSSLWERKKKNIGSVSFSSRTYIFYNFQLTYIPVAGHLGRDKTYKKIAVRFYWKSLWKGVFNFVQTCERCWTANDAKFVKEAAPLPVKQEA